MNARQLWFTGPSQVEFREQTLKAPGAGEILLRTLYSGISAGTEMLLYRGQVPASTAQDASLDATLEQDSSWPLQSGYACVGRVEQTGEAVDTDWLGRTVFAFQPHASHQLCALEDVIPVPENLDPAAAVFLANMETAVNLVLDAGPDLGGRVVVIGQGMVGLLTSSLLAACPLEQLVAVEATESRRAAAGQAGVLATFDPDSADDMAALREKLQPDTPGGGADVVIELSGSPAALNLAMELCGYAGRIVVGSWYGTKTAPLNLGERFHRQRLEIISSQVSTIAPRLRGRWDKARRFGEAWRMIKKCQPEQFISHRLPLESAAEAYRLLDESPDEVLQIVFTYE